MSQIAAPHRPGSWRTQPARRGLLVASGLVLSAALTACAPNLGPRPQLADPAAFKSDHALAAPSADWPQTDWWTAYQDPVLAALIEEGLQNSPTLREAKARLTIAQGAAGVAGAATSPSLNGQVVADEYLQSKNLGFPPFIQPLLPGSFHAMGLANLNFAYDLDLFGRNRANLAAAVSEAEAARADAAQSRLILSTSIAAAYADLRRLSADRDAAAAAVEVRKKTLALVGQRLANGLETRGEFKLQSANVPAAEAEVLALDRQIGLARNQLSALLGKGPDRGLDIALPADAPHLRPFGLPDHLPARLVGRRPDVTAARLRAQAAARRIRAANAAFYPDINLSGTVGYQSLGLDKLFYNASRTGQFGPALNLPIFSGGRASADYKSAFGGYALAVASYDETLTNALKDVADAAVSIRALTAQLAKARLALSESEEAYRIAAARYEGGLSPYLSVLTSENNLIAQRRNVADLEGLAFTYDVSLVRALGGGYVAPAKPVGGYVAPAKPVGGSAAPVEKS